MDPKTRTLLRVKVLQTARTIFFIARWTADGQSLEARFEFISENAKFVTDLDI